MQSPILMYLTVMVVSACNSLNKVVEKMGREVRVPIEVGSARGWTRYEVSHSMVALCM